MLDYETTMRIGASRYQNVVDDLADAGWSATFTQTGGMNAALEVQLEAGCTLLITDEDDALPWDRTDQLGWGVSFYADPDRYAHPERYDGHLAYASSNDTDSKTLLDLVGTVVRQGVAELLRRHRA